VKKLTEVGQSLPKLAELTWVHAEMVYLSEGPDPSKDDHKISAYLSSK